MCLVLELMDRRGGLAMLWKLEVEVEIMNFPLRHINGLITDDEKSTKWFLTGFYGHPETSKRKESRALMSFLKPPNNQAWCVVGDFNGILSQGENRGADKG